MASAGQVSVDVRRLRVCGYVWRAFCDSVRAICAKKKPLNSHTRCVRTHIRHRTQTPTPPHKPYAYNKYKAHDSRSRRRRRRRQRRHSFILDLNFPLASQTAAGGAAAAAAAAPTTRAVPRTSPIRTIPIRPNGTRKPGCISVYRPSAVGALAYTAHSRSEPLSPFPGYVRIWQHFTTPPISTAPVRGATAGATTTTTTADNNNHTSVCACVCCFFALERARARRNVLCVDSARPVVVCA